MQDEFKKKLVKIKRVRLPLLISHFSPQKFDWEIREGEPGVEICKRAQELKADYLFMGHGGWSSMNVRRFFCYFFFFFFTFGRVFLGNICNYCLHNAPCSVMIVKRQDKDE